MTATDKKGRNEVVKARIRFSWTVLALLQLSDTNWRRGGILSVIAITS